MSILRRHGSRFLFLLLVATSAGSSGASRRGGRPIPAAEQAAAIARTLEGYERDVALSANGNLTQRFVKKNRTLKAFARLRDSHTRVKRAVGFKVTRLIEAAEFSQYPVRGAIDLEEVPGLAQIIRLGDLLPEASVDLRLLHEILETTVNQTYNMNTFDALAKVMDDFPPFADAFKRLLLKHKRTLNLRLSAADCASPLHELLAFL